jgi:hypothetical protein
LWLDHFAPDGRFVGLTVFDDDRMVAALPLYATSRLPFSRLRLPGNFWSAAGDLLLDNSIHSGRGLDVLVAALARHSALALQFDLLLSDTQRWRAFFAALERRGLQYICTERFKIGRIAIGDDWQAYMASRSGNHRRHMRKAINRANGRAPLELVRHRLTSTDDIESLLRTAFEIEDQSWKGREGSSILKTAGMFDFYVLQTRLLASYGNCELVYLNQGGKPIAFEYAWTGKGTYFSPKVGYDEQFDDITPGQLLRYRFYEELHANRASADAIQEIDFCGPIVDATRKWVTSEYTVSKLIIATERPLSLMIVYGYERLRTLVRQLREKLHRRQMSVEPANSDSAAVKLQSSAKDKSTVQEPELVGATSSE